MTTLAPRPFVEHPLSRIFPDMRPDAFAELKASIADQGQHHPIICVAPDDSPNFEILDGRHRFRACSELGIDVSAEIIDLNPDEYQDFVLACNQHRRMMTDSDRALVAARLAEYGNASIAQAAEQLGASERQISRAKHVIANPDLESAVAAGQVSLSKAADIASSENTETLAQAARDLRQGRAPDLTTAIENARAGAMPIAKIREQKAIALESLAESEGFLPSIPPGRRHDRIRNHLAAVRANDHVIATLLPIVEQLPDLLKNLPQNDDSNLNQRATATVASAQLSITTAIAASQKRNGQARAEISKAR